MWARRVGEPIGGKFFTLQHELVAWLGVRVIAFESNGKGWADIARARDGDGARFAALADLPLKGVLVSDRHRAHQKVVILPPAWDRDGHWEG